MSKFRKRPVVIEAQLFDGDFLDMVNVTVWCSGSMEREDDLYAWVLKIPTLEGVMTAQVGDWIVKGVAGEFYSCKPDIFEMTYEPVNE